MGGRDAHDARIRSRGVGGDRQDPRASTEGLCGRARRGRGSALEGSGPSGPGAGARLVRASTCPASPARAAGCEVHAGRRSVNPPRLLALLRRHLLRAARASGLTGVKGGFPSSTATQFSTASVDILTRVSFEALPMWGARTTFGNPIRPGLRSGSFSNTSSPAPAIHPSRSAWTSAPSSTTGPLDALTRYAVFLIARSDSALIRWR